MLIELKKHTPAILLSKKQTKIIYHLELHTSQLVTNTT